jgi:hypothetical protein
MSGVDERKLQNVHIDVCSHFGLKEVSQSVGTLWNFNAVDGATTAQVWSGCDK